MNSDYYIRAMRIDDIEQVSNIHLLAFKGFFLSFLGKSFLKELYKFIITDEFGIAFVAVENSSSQLVGFVAGSSNPSDFYMRAIKKGAIRFALASIPAILRKPTIIVRLLRAFKKPIQARSLYQVSELMSIAVTPGIELKGIGTALEKSFCEKARERNSLAVILDTDKDNNERANLFYIKNGYSLYDTFITPENRRMNKYIKYI